MASGVTSGPALRPLEVVISPSQRVQQTAVQRLLEDVVFGNVSVQPAIAGLAGTKDRVKRP